VSEAFVTGLMLDCGIPLMLNVVGESYNEVYSATQTPDELFVTEMRRLFCTHVDVAAVLMRGWRIPMTLAKPIGWHHAPMPANQSNDPSVALRRIACCVGAVNPLAAEFVTEQTDAATGALGIPGARMADAVSDAGREYTAMMQLFSDIAEPVHGVASLAEAVHAQLVRTLDEQPNPGHAQPTSMTRVRVGCNDITLERQSDGRVKATIYTTSNEPLLTQLVRPEENPKTLLAGLGIDTAAEPDMARLTKAMGDLKIPAPPAGKDAAPRAAA
jgi:hypothetical protein